MKKIISATAFVLISFLTIQCVAQQENYSRVRIFTNDEGLRQLSGYGIAIDHGTYRKGVYFESDFSEREIQIIAENSFNYDILIEDVVAFYRNRAARNEEPEMNTLASGCGQALPAYPTPANFSLGTMSGFFTYNEFITHIDNMFSQYPNLITQKQPIGAFITWDGYPIYWMKISDNPAIDEPEPEVLYTAIHHAREPGALSQQIFYMWYLLENYGSDPEVTYLVDNTEMYFIPMVNPDGYNYVETTDPMWRKNRRDNLNGDWGVDLNRNYGYNWGYDNNGSSPNTNSQVYRGPSAFSEPETQAMKSFVESREFKLALNYHTYGNLHIYPWGYLPNIYTPDSAQFVENAKVMTSENNYNYGTGNQTVGYVVNGDADDWMYGEQITKPKIMAVTPEVGTSADGFWPPPAKIIPHCNENMRQNLNQAHLALKFAIAEEQNPTVIDQLSGYFIFKVTELGLDTPATITVNVTPIGTEIQSVGAAINLTGMGLLETRTDSISFTLNPGIIQGQEFRYLLSVSNGNYTWTDTIVKVYGQIIVLFTENADAMSNWTSSSWGVSNSVYYSPTGSITDSPFGNYSNNSTTEITLNNPIDLTNADYGMLTFWTKWEIESGWDYAQTLVSDDGGNTWTPICGKHTKTGNANQDPGKPLYDGFQINWVHEEMNLKDYLGKNILIRFLLSSDIWSTEDGFYFDDLTVEVIENNIGINENANDAGIRIFPNPNSGQFTLSIEVKERDGLSIRIINMLGQEMLQIPSEQLADNSIEIDLSKFAKGVYYLQIVTATAVHTEKVVYR